MALKSTFTPKASLCDSPTNLKEAIDWVLRVTGRDGKKLGDGECICGLAAAVTDLLQSVQLEYHGYEGDRKDSATDEKKGPPKGNVTERLNELFSLVQGLGGTAVVRTYIDQLAQVLSALVGWSRIEKCSKGCGKGNQHGKSGCKYLQDVQKNTPCDKCKCMKWDVPEADDNKNGHHLGRRCKRCSDSGDSDCQCKGSTPSSNCTAGKECKCALAGKCCRCCCTNCIGCKNECICTPEESITRYRLTYVDFRIDRYMSSYIKESATVTTWKDVGTTTNRYQCAQTLLGSVCLIWSGLTYMYWTGKYHKSSPRWNNHILDGRGVDDGTLSQWLQALGFPRDMLNDAGPGNRWDAIIWDGIMGKLYLGFPDTSPSGSGVHGKDYDDNTFRQPAGMNYAGYIHTVDRGAFCSKATVFKKASGATITEENINKCGALYKLYILSCAYFTGLQKKNATQSTTNTTPRTIREILYWLSALPYSQAYPEILKHGKDRLTEVTKKTGDNGNETPTLAFHQTGRTHPITVHEFNLFAHFQAVTQYCPLVLIGIQGGLHSATKGTDGTKEPPIHSLYANTECNFTYPTVDIQAYNQVVHYIRALFYQLYFLRKQCAVKVTCGGKWRECRYGSGVLGKGVISWMCLGCDPMEHDRNYRVEKVEGELDGVINKLKALEWRKQHEEEERRKEKLEKAEELITLFEAIGNVVVQLGNAQEALERKDEGVIEKVKKALEGAKERLGTAKEVLDKVKKVNSGLTGKLGEAKGKLDELTNGGNSGKLGEVVEKLEKDKDQGKNALSSAINKVHEVMKLIKEWAEQDKDEVICHLKDPYNEFLKAIEDLISICNSPRPASNQLPLVSPPPLQAFLEDRLPGFSCSEVPDTDQPDYPSAASHLGHCGGSGQCCPLPMGFRGHFQNGSTGDSTGARLYGILYFFSNENMMQSCVYTLVRVTAELSATTPQVLGDVFGFFRGGVGNPVDGKGDKTGTCNHEKDPKDSKHSKEYFCGWCASGLRDEVKKMEWIQKVMGGEDYRKSVGAALIAIKGDKGTGSPAPAASPSALSTLTKDSEYVSPLTGELYTAVSATFGGTYLSWVLYLSDALEGGLKSLSDAFQEIECRGCRECDPNKCKKGSHGVTGSALCQCQSIVSCTGVLPVLYRHGFSYGNPFNLEGYQQKDGKVDGQYDIEDKKKERTKQCHQFLDSLQAVINAKKESDQKDHPLTNLLSQVGKLQYDIRLPWIFVLTVAWLVAVLYLAFGAIWPLDWTHMRSHWLRGGEHQWQCMWYKVMTGRKGMELVEYFERR